MAFNLIPFFLFLKSFIDCEFVQERDHQGAAQTRRPYRCVDASIFSFSLSLSPSAFICITYVVHRLKAYAMGYLVYKSLQPYSKDVWSLAVTLPFFLCGLTCELASSHHRLPLSQSTIVDLTCMMVSGIRLEWSEVTFLQNSHMIHFWSISDPFLIHLLYTTDINRYQRLHPGSEVSLREPDPELDTLWAPERCVCRCGCRAELGNGEGSRCKECAKGCGSNLAKPWKTMENPMKNPCKLENLQQFGTWYIPSFDGLFMFVRFTVKFTGPKIGWFLGRSCWWLAKSSLLGSTVCCAAKALFWCRVCYVPIFCWNSACSAGLPTERPEAC